MLGPISSARNDSGPNSPAMRPSLNTISRSLTAKSSSRSSEIGSTAAPAARVAKCGAHRLGATRVETPSGIKGNDKLRPARELAGQDEPLLISAGKHRGSHIERQWRKMESGGALLHVGGKSRPIEAQPATIAPPGAEHQFWRTVRPGISARASGSSGMLAAPLSRMRATDHPLARSPRAASRRGLAGADRG